MYGQPAERSERDPGTDLLTRQGPIATGVDELRSAICSGQFSVQYQPIVDVADDLVIGAEALVRWIHPVRGVLLPAEFIGLAEQSGLIGLIGERVLKQACLDATSWRLYRCNQAKVAVNVADQQLRDPAFTDLVSAALAESGLPARRLVLEVTESSVAGEDEVAIHTLRRLRKLGVRVAIDDFGTGLSDLSRLSTMPVDLLKLDRSFITQLETSTRARALLRGLIGMANALGLRAVIEGIENQQQARIVAAMGGHEGQGWLWGQPADSDQFARDGLSPFS
ncbi:MAG: EAL domain-containing protein [Jatrophihabitantaceae bacterium]